MKQDSMLATATDMDLSSYLEAAGGLQTMSREGRVTQVIGLTIEAEGLRAQLGEQCYIEPGVGEPLLYCEVTGFRYDRIILMALGEMHGIRPGSRVVAGGRLFSTPVGDELLGRIIDGLGRPIDGRGPILTPRRSTVTNTPPHPLRRRRVDQPLETGVRSLDGLLTCGKGQRIGIFAGSGVGKSTLLSMIARHAQSDVTVLALIGERGREVRDFIDRDLGEEGLKRSVVVVSTSDQPSLVRLKGAWVATAIAEYFRDQGADVTFLMDSVTRFAMAQREIGLAVGEPPAAKGYTPSVFALLPRLMERAGSSEIGTITGFYTVLVEGDDLTEPITDTARSILDGHIVLTRELADRNHYPAVDVLQSISRVMPDIVSPEQLEQAGWLREAVAMYNDSRDLINIGAYVSGSNPQIDFALRALPHINTFLSQRPDEVSEFQTTVEELRSIFLLVGRPGQPEQTDGNSEEGDE